MKFQEAQFEHNRAFLLLSDLEIPYKSPVKPGVDSQLLTFFQQLPNLISFEFPLKSGFEDTIQAILTYRISMGDEKYHDLLFGSSESGSNVSGTTRCGHIFKKGEGIYRCHDCGWDETCVLCTKCFRASSHENHNTSFHYSQGSGGCCDCGDPEAWKVPGSCTVHSVREPDDEIKTPLPDELMDAIRKTIATVLEMIICTFDNTPSDLSIPTDLESLRKDSKFDKDQGSARQYSVILWNDESHSFAEVIEQLMESIGCTVLQGKEFADLVHTNVTDF